MSSLYPPTGQKTSSPQPPSPTPGKKTPLLPRFRRLSKAKSFRRKVRDSTVITRTATTAEHVAIAASSCSSSERSSLSDADHDHVSPPAVRGATGGLGAEPTSPLRSGISPQTQASMDNVFRWAFWRIKSIKYKPSTVDRINRGDLVA